MIPALFDTSIYIYALRQGDDALLTSRRAGGDALLWLSAVVLQELYAGVDLAVLWLNVWSAISIGRDEFLCRTSATGH